jgi:hypothetical protein
MDVTSTSMQENLAFQVTGYLGARDEVNVQSRDYIEILGDLNESILVAINFSLLQAIGE